MNSKFSVLIYFTATLAMHFYKAFSKSTKDNFSRPESEKNATTEIMHSLVELQLRTSAEQSSLMDIADTVG